MCGSKVCRYPDSCSSCVQQCHCHITECPALTPQTHRGICRALEGATHLEQRWQRCARWCATTGRKQRRQHELQHVLEWHVSAGLLSLIALQDRERRVQEGVRQGVGQGVGQGQEGGDRGTSRGPERSCF